MSDTAPLILLAEDNRANAEIMSEVIRVFGYRVEVVGTGRSAVERATALQPALVLMDVEMPDMDGIEATRTLRADPRTAQLPVVCLTAHSLPDETKRCIEAGANLHVAKPVDLPRLADVLQRFAGPAKRSG